MRSDAHDARTTAAGNSSRVPLSVLYADKEEAKRHGARWDSVLQKWWIARRDIASHPGIGKWIVDDALSAQALEAQRFMEGTHPKQHRPHSPLQLQLCADLSSPDTLPAGLVACDCLTPPWDDCPHTFTGD